MLLITADVMEATTVLGTKLFAIGTTRVVNYY